MDKVARLYEGLRRICHNYFMVMQRRYIQLHCWKDKRFRSRFYWHQPIIFTHLPLHIAGLQSLSILGFVRD